jgi:hypothetical protein
VCLKGMSFVMHGHKVLETYQEINRVFTSRASLNVSSGHIAHPSSPIEVRRDQFQLFFFLIYFISNQNLQFYELIC